jgi:pyrimidine operon attenuation protein/uracil phosphoribosyltransferase
MARDIFVALDAEAIERATRRLAAEVIERNRGAEGLALVGVRRGGDVLVRRIAAQVEKIEGRRPEVGSVDIGLYRDDAFRGLNAPKIGPTEIRFKLDDRVVVLVDDVLYTGRTVRAAIDCLLDFGRPRRVELLVLVDRGGRELPIRADYVGATVEAGPERNIEVRWVENGAVRDEAVVRERGP